MSTHLLTPFSITSSTRLDASCKNVLLEMLDIRLRLDISEIEDRRDEPEIPILLENVLPGDFNELFFNELSLLLSKLFGDARLLYPLVVLLFIILLANAVPFSSFRVFDRDNRFLNVPKIVVFFRSRPRSEISPEIGSFENSL